MARKAKIKRVRKGRRTKRAKPNRYLVAPHGLLEAMNDLIKEMQAELEALRRFKPILALNSEAQESLLALVPNMRHKTGRRPA